VVTIKTLSTAEISVTYGIVSELYSHVPSMSIWRACEYAAYKHFSLLEPILDIGCGDGQFFRLVWPEAINVVGIDIDPTIISSATSSGVYTEVHNISTVNMPFAAESFASAFANCSLEHMDNLDLVLTNIWNVLKPGGMFLLSVTTDKFLEWTTLPQLMKLLQLSGMEDQLLERYKTYHHLVSAFPPEVWASKLHSAGFDVLEHVPIVPEFLGRLNMSIDMLWHLPLSSHAEYGSVLEPYFQKLNNFPEELGNIVRALLEMEANPLIGSGAVFMARKRETSD